MKIDAHQHYWSINRGDYGWITPQLPVLYKDFLPQHLSPYIHKHKIAGTILVQAAPTLEESLYILQLAEHEPSILGVVGWVDLFSEQHEQQYLQLSKYCKLVGLRFMIQELDDSDLILQPHIINRIAYYAEREIPLDLLVVSHQLHTIIKLLDIFPNLNAVINHIGKPNIFKADFALWSEQLQQISKYKGVYCKISGLVTEADHKNWTKEQFTPYIRHVLSSFGENRVMFGSDWPVCLLAASYDEVIDIVEAALPSSLSNQERKQLFGLNAAHFYNVKGE